jgi:2-keto-4-pentenoate hydratase/2-oxohepta-3-ene-1,7-dioic acid hydratase in catechol pathway
MKLVTFKTEKTQAAGYIDDGHVVACVTGKGALTAIRDLLSDGNADLAAWKAQGGERFALADVRLLAPIPEPRRDILCVGKNYRAHAAEFHASGFDSTGKEAVPEYPVIFTKAMTSVVGPDDDVRGSLDPTNSVDYEGELGVILGKPCFQVAKADAMDHVFGYMIINDVTSRLLQQRHNQWVIGKGLDTFCPMGPWIVTADEAGDPRQMRLQTRINDELRQDAPVSDLIFDIPTLIEIMSRTMTLLPGDIIATGTAEGVGIGFKPPKYLVAGDHMSVSITGLGTLENTIV